MVREVSSNKVLLKLNVLTDRAFKVVQGVKAQTDVKKRKKKKVLQSGVSDIYIYIQYCLPL